MNTHIHCHNHQLHCGEIMMDVCGHVGFFFFSSTPCLLINLRQQQLGSEQQYYHPVCYFLSRPYSDANWISFGHISPGRIWHCEVVRHGFGTATLPSLFCLSQAIIAGLSICHLVFCKVLIHLWPLTCWKNLIPAQLKLPVHPVCKRTSNTNHHTNLSNVE